jgi:hypothetical protein
VLLINGTHSAGSQYSINEGGTLGGTGATDAPVSIEGGTLAPGASVGTFTVNNTVAFETGSRFAVEIDGAAADKLVAIDLNLSGDEYLDVSLLAEMIGTSWLIAEYSGTLEGVFDAVTSGYAVNYDTPGEVHLQFVGVAGDYNSNGVVDAADYTVWRDLLGSEVTAGTGADGSGPGGLPDGFVDQFDYQLWTDHFGEMAAGSGSIAAANAIPEPTTGVLAGLVIGWLFQFGAIRR